MLTEMQLLWIQYWTALPVIVEDRDMSDGGQMGGRMPPATFPLDPSGQYRLNDSEGNTRMCRVLDASDDRRAGYHEGLLTH